MKIAMLGTRGIPANYSGFETAVEELSVRLAERGHDVTVYCRKHMIEYDGLYYKGVRLVKLPTIKNKHLDTIFHTFISTFHMLLRGRPDVALYFIAGNSPCTFIPRLAGVPTAINVDGLDSKRAKWSGAAKLYLRFAEWLAPRAANEVIADSRVIQDYYRDRFGARSVFIPYGASMKPEPGTEWLERFGLAPREYILFVGRLVPENSPHVLIEAFDSIGTDKKLVVVGDAPYSGEYIKSLKSTASDRVIFTGYVYGEGYRQLSQNAYLVAVPTVVGGTHPVIVESLAAGNCVIVSDHPPNIETVGDAGVSFAADNIADLRRHLQQLLGDPGLVEEYRKKAAARAAEKYDWGAITGQYEELCRRLAHGTGKD